MSTPLDINQLSDVAAEEDKGQAIVMDDEFGEPYDPPVTFRVAGEYSTRFRSADARFMRSLRKTGSQRKAEKKIAEERPLFIGGACVLGWSGVKAGDEDVPCTQENVSLVLDRAPWMLDQVWGAIRDHSGFTESNSET